MTDELSSQKYHMPKNISFGKRQNQHILIFLLCKVLLTFWNLRLIP